MAWVCGECVVGWFALRACWLVCSGSCVVAVYCVACICFSVCSGCVFGVLVKSVVSYVMSVW